MSKIKTKQDILSAMSEYGACSSAVEYVRAAPETATAREIWLGCADVDWLAWFGARHRPAALQAFVYACADRAVRVYAADVLARSGLVAEAEKMRALAPIVDADTARAGEVAARAAACYARPAKTARYAANAANSTRFSAYYSVRYATYFAGAAEAVEAPEGTESLIQLDALHALADAVLEGA